MKMTVLAAGLLACGIAAQALAAPAQRPVGITLVPIGTYLSVDADGKPLFDQSAAEIVAHDPSTQRVFVVNFAEKAIDILNISDPRAPTRFGQITFENLGGAPNSVAVSNGLVAVAIENPVKIENGWAVFLDTDGNVLNTLMVGALPDMIAFTPDGKTVLVANEGEPSNPYVPGTDPEGSVSIIDISGGVGYLTDADVKTAGFEAFNSQRDALIAQGVRIHPAAPRVAQDLEPEYIAVSDDSTTAWVSLQENNALAVIDIASATATAILPLGRKDHSIPGNGLDASNRSVDIDIRTWPRLYGIHMPDAIASYSFRGQNFVLTANEGDAREWGPLMTDVSRVRDLRDITNDGDGDRELALCEDAFPDREDLVEQTQLGRLNVSTIDGYNAQDNCFEELHAFGARSFSIWTADGQLVFDSGDQFEKITADVNPDFFNSNHRETLFKNRSDDKGPEPEPVTVAKLLGRTYAFVGFERIGGVIIYDITNPYAPYFVDYTNNRDFSINLAQGEEEGNEESDADYAARVALELPRAGDLGIEDIVVIQPKDSPIGRPLVVTANEVSGTTTIFEVVPKTPGVGRRLQ
jgi:2',3'-cyclic-nucleotide 2'-phosphodiesterase / 3'-nucleotidase / 5'-nucleotidase